MVIPTHLRALQALQLAVRTGSLAQTAEKLSITPAAVGQRIKSLEDFLGLDLIVRGRSGIMPTRELAGALIHLNAAFKELETVTDILDFQRVQEIHIISDQDFAELWLKPRLAEFRASNPNILFCVNGVGDVPTRLGMADCTIEFGIPKNSDCEDILFKDYLLPIGSPANTLRVLELPKGERLEGFPLLHLDCYKSDLASIGWPEWVSKYGYRKTAANRGIRYAHLIHALDAVYSDAGLVICGLALIIDQLNSQKLSTPFPLSQGSFTGYTYSVTFRRDAARRSQINQFREWLVQEGQKTEQSLESYLKH
jgi:LysR family transcriptional regulator, glycine cleavage system transcriptional activator